MMSKSGLNLKVWKYGLNTPIYEFNDVLYFNLRHQINTGFMDILYVLFFLR